MGFRSYATGTAMRTRMATLRELRIVPDDSLTAPTLAFGNVRIRKAVDSTATLTNNGVDSTFIQSATIIGTGFGIFSIAD